MFSLRRLFRRAQVVIAPALGIAVSAYFVYHLIEGDRGLRSWVGTSKDLRVANGELADAEQQLAALRLRISHFARDPVDKDLLDEQVRRVLGYANPDEIVIMRGNQPPAP